MKANYLDMNRKKRLAKQMSKDYLNRECRSMCEKCLEKMNHHCVKVSKYNALFHVMHLLVILHREYGFGKTRLERLLLAYYEADRDFKEDLSDGVGWTKTIKYLEALGLEFSDEDKRMGQEVERLFEKDITYNKKDD